ncbi:MAG: hypothetical protein JSR82_01525 [Verrucomicrobia bacterium]|nr:hypothetical protein [Verrucomicrobiota bacterium]
MKSLALLISGVCLTASLGAQTPAAPSSAADIKLTNRSSFSREGIRRSPFLPIGHTKKVESVATPTFTEIRAEQFKISAILLGNPPIAIINGKDRGVGDRIPVGNEAVTVKRIEDGQVILLHRDREIVVPQGGRR